MPPFSILPAGGSDARALHAVRAAAYKDSLLHALFMPTPLKPHENEEYQAWQLQLMKSRVGVAPGRFYFKAVDDSTGEVVGFACWAAPKKEIVDSSGDDGDPKPARPKFVDVDVLGRIESQFARAKDEILGERIDDVWYIAALCVKPEIQRHGIGDQLVKQGLRDLVDKDGSDCYLESSEAGVKLYTQNGFMSKMSFPLLDSKYVSTIMLRRASEQESKP